MNIARWLILLLLTTSVTTYGQIDAVVPDTLLDKFYINWPIDPEREDYLPGDTVVAIYNTQPNNAEELFESFFNRYPVTKPKPVYVVRACVSDAKCFTSENKNYTMGLN